MSHAAGRSCLNWIFVSLSVSCSLPMGINSASGQVLQGQETQTVAIPVASLEHSANPPTNLSELLKVLLLESLRDDYVNMRHWGGTIKRFDGLKIRGLHISKRERDVPHGIWRRYKATLVQPEKTFDARVTQLEPLPSGKIPFSIEITLRARCEATFAWWAYGVKGLNGTAVSHATLQLRMILETSPTIALNLNTPFPQVELRPTVKSVELELKDLDVDRLGVLRGDLAEILGKGSQQAVEVLIQKQEEKIRSKLQKGLDKAGI